MASAGRVLLIPKGTWISGASYSMLDVVYYEGASYVAKGAVSGTTPPVYDTDNWQIMCSGLETYSNAGAHNAIYRGKNLGSAVTDAQYEAIGNGTFDDLYIGDYWVTNGITWRIAAFDYYLRCGDSDLTTHHAVVVPDSVLYNHVMNDTNTAEGSYAGSKMYREGLESAKTTIKAAFSVHVLSHRVYLTNALANGKPSGGVWCDSEVDLMCEEMVYGGSIFRSASDGSSIPINHRVEKSQLPLFAYRPDLISIRIAYWLRDAASANGFAFVSDNGRAEYNDAAASIGVRPAFCICKQNAA